jgi:hypothetical protein
MPILALTKVMIEYVGQTFDRLAPVIRQMAKKKKNK